MRKLILAAAVATLAGCTEAATQQQLIEQTAQKFRQQTAQYEATQKGADAQAQMNDPMLRQTRVDSWCQRTGGSSERVAQCEQYYARNPNIPPPSDQPRSAPINYTGNPNDRYTTREGYILDGTGRLVGYIGEPGGQPTAVTLARAGWISDQNGCRIWDPIPMLNESVTWSGACVNGFAEGSGVLRWFLNSDPAAQHFGELRDGRGSGYGVLTKQNGDRYEGNFRDSLFNGHGVYSTSSGYRYDGDFQAGKLNGHGVQSFPNGDRYEGNFQDDKRNGYGVYTKNDGERLAGQWRDGHFRQSPGEVSLAQRDGALVVPAIVNGAIRLNFTLDTGASDVSIPADVVMTLIRTGTIADDDFLGKQTYVLADGSRVPSLTFRIRSLKVGDHVVGNVIGSVAPVSGGLLLGQSFLKHFRHWSVDNERMVLVLE